MIEQLAMLGLQTNDIDMLICTHFDLDHASRHGAFTSAEFIVQQAHYTQARHDKRFSRTRPQWDQPNIRYRFIEGDTQLLPGLEIIETSGHRSGHQSVLVRLPETGPVLLAIDAVAAQDNFTPERKKSPVDDDEEQLRASTRKLLELAEREQVALVVFGHDAQQWSTLKKAPEYYS